MAERDQVRRYIRLNWPTHTEAEIDAAMVKHEDVLADGMKFGSFPYFVGNKIADELEGWGEELSASDDTVWDGTPGADEED